MNTEHLCNTAAKQMRAECTIKRTSASWHQVLLSVIDESLKTLRKIAISFLFLFFLDEAKANLIPDKTSINYLKLQV